MVGLAAGEAGGGADGGELDGAEGAAAGGVELDAALGVDEVAGDEGVGDEGDGVEVVGGLGEDGLPVFALGMGQIDDDDAAVGGVGGGLEEEDALGTAGAVVTSANLPSISRRARCERPCPASLPEPMPSTNRRNACAVGIRPAEVCGCSSNPASASATISLRTVAGLTLAPTEAAICAVIVPEPTGSPDSI